MKDSLTPDLNDNKSVTTAKNTATVDDNNTKTNLSEKNITKKLTEDNVLTETDSKLHNQKTTDKKVIKNPKKEMNENLKPVYTDSVTKDIATTKNFAWLAYLLFFIPMFINRDSGFVKHNVNQGLKLNIIDLLSMLFLVLGTSIKTASQTWQFVLVVFVYIGLGLVFLTLMLRVYMITMCLKGKESKLPVFSDTVIIK